MEEKYIYTRKEYSETSVKIARQSNKTWNLTNPKEIMYVLFSINSSVQKVYMFPEDNAFDIVVIANEPFDAYALNFFRQYKDINFNYKITVKKKLLWFINKTIQKVKICH